MPGCFVALGAVSFCDLAENLVCQLPLYAIVNLFSPDCSSKHRYSLFVTFILLSSPAVSS